MRDARAYQCSGWEQVRRKSSDEAVYRTHKSAKATMVPNGTMGHVIVENKQRNRRVSVPMAPSRVSSSIVADSSSGVSPSGAAVA
jgi:predicted RNA binding protein YcfA (HicA-like mRNA interferase family)